MARAKKTDSIDLSQRHTLTAGAIERLTCPPDKAQAFMRDSEVPSLRVRVTPAGAKSFVFEAKLKRGTIRRTIGDVRDWDIPRAREEARRLAVMIDNGLDPREVERQQQAEREAQKKQQEAHDVTAGDVWLVYLEKGRPKRKEEWKPRYLVDMRLMASKGGEPKKRGQGLTRSGPLYPLLSQPLHGITDDVLAAWFEDESKQGRHQATRALMMFRGFLRWCSARPEYRNLVHRDAGKAQAIAENLPSTTTRNDRLDPAMLEAWWQGVEQLSNQTASTYLRALLLSGARREELAALKWTDVDFRWRKITIADKVHQTREIPLCGYMAHILSGLPRKGLYVFASASKTGRIVDTRASHDKVLKAAGIEHLTLHGLRRSFASFGAKVAPELAVRQIMGHAAKDAHGDYVRFSLSELREFHQKIEAMLLEQAGITFDSKAEVGRLRVVA